MEIPLILKRLQIDDAAFKKAALKYHELVNEYEERDEESLSTLIDEFVDELRCTQHALERHALIQQANKIEVENYQAESLKIMENIMSTKEQIQDLKNQLATARQDRRNKTEYDRIALLINKLPTKDQINNRINKVKLEQNKLEELRVEQESLIQLRKDKLSSVFKLFHETQKVFSQNKSFEEERYYNLGLDEEDVEEEEDNEEKDDDDKDEEKKE